MKKITKIVVITILVLAIYSFLPVIALYLSPEPSPYSNDQAVGRLSNNAGDSFRFIIFGDNHAGLIFNDSAALKMIWSINRDDRFRKLPIDFVAILGDATLTGTAWDYRIFNRIRSLIKYPVITAIGNHDEDSGGVSLFKKYAGKAEFSFVDRNSYFIVMDNAIGDLTEEQFANFESELKKSVDYKHRFVILHKPPLSPYSQDWYAPEVNPWSLRFMNLCEKYKVDAVLAGHEHMFKEETLGGVKYITSGGGGMLTHLPDSDGGFLHYIIVRVHGDYVDYEVRKNFPPFWEYITYYLWKDIFYQLKDMLV